MVRKELQIAKDELHNKVALTELHRTLDGGVQCAAQGPSVAGGFGYPEG